jgi:hypothetical protein
MKRILMAMVFVLLMASQSWAAWTLTASKVSQTKHYLLWKVLCTSDGSAMTATNLLGSTIMSSELKGLVQGTTHMILKVSPGTGGVAPDTTIDVVLLDAQSTAIFTHAAFSGSADTIASLAEDYGSYPTVYGALYLTLSDIGTTGDQVTLYFESWIE